MQSSYYENDTFSKRIRGFMVMVITNVFCCGNTLHSNKREHLGLETTIPSTPAQSIVLAWRIIP
jgi:hypothetical protein